MENGASLARLMPNIGDTRQSKWRLLVSIILSRMLKAVTVWAKVLRKQNLRNTLASVPVIEKSCTIVHLR